MNTLDFKPDSFKPNFYENTLEVKGSKFISLIYPLQHLDEVKKLTLELKASHKKASHVVNAFRFYDVHIVEGSSDDGEPKGSAGEPLLSVLRGKDLVNVVAFCVRYFGGIKLGVGGLVRAYSTSLNDNLAALSTIKFEPLEKLELVVNISYFNKVTHLLNKHQVTFESEFEGGSVSLVLKAPKANLESFMQDYKAFMRL
ncbi:hypothetical protein BKH43_08135 [Helicobacter sp. 13S00401-1]|uniref:IMPACT family protein n=1 Tax=Helicobacter sp. 13S00401-1 TaxID=1905758 RepID=UPI000BA7497E|nr:YigZ family protein [Helicobacter sp. 13S00401-1]PAF47720.1 hypothetical protein BKH43_08135 [Helicobacter sp. 13S00401-1]